ncbi:MAG: UvrD-helicase domain-containing protein, partial [Acidimicrobiales bacterium]
MSEPVVFDDDAARAAITDRLDETLFVEAGAGTGKTTALVGRVLELVRTERTTLGRIAAITFTEAAAADLRSRIHLKLSEAARAPDGAWARQALGDLDDASMTTIHGFAQRILAEHPLAAGLPLRFRVSDEIEYDLAVERRFREVIDGLVADDERGQLLAGALGINIKIGTLSELAAEVDSKWDRFVDVDRKEIPIASVAAAVDAAEAELAEAVAAVLPLRDGCDDDEDGLATQLDELEEALALRASSQDWVDRLEWCYGLRKINYARSGAKTAWKGLPIAEVREIVGKFETRRDAIVKRITGELLRALVGVFAEEAVEAATARRTAGELSFHDLLAFAHELLRSHPEVTRQVSARYSYILVDEFQDTDPLQLEIVTDLAKRADGDRLVPGKLFFVGDPRQSIYRFRGAEPELYERALDRLVPSGPLLLTSNFRSVPPILGFVNAVFARLFDGEDDSAPRHHALSVVRDGGLAGSVKVCGAEAEERLSAHERRVREVGDIAELIDRCVREGWPVEDDGAERPACYGDIAILVTKRTGLAELEEALDERNIPFRADSPSLILRSFEVRDFLACLRAIDSPGDDTAMISALRTPLLACGDDDLWRYRRGGGRWSLEAAGSSADPVAGALCRLRSLADRRHDLGVLGTMHAVAGELGIFELAATTRHCDESLRRLLYLFARASAFVDAGGASIASFVEWIDRQSGARVRGVEAAVEDGDGAVRILTVHAAKGLEFPVVLLAELAADPARQSAAGYILFDTEGRPEVRVRSGVETPGYAALYDEERQRADDELVRLLYVAMTRARDHLALSLHRSTFSSKSTPSLADRVAELLGDLDGLYEVLDDARPVPERSEAVAAPPSGPAATKAAFAKWREGREAVCRTSALPISVGARTLEAGTGHTPRVGAPAVDDGDAPSDTERWKHPRGATAIGRAVHGVLQRVGLRDGHGLADLVVSEVARAGCTDAHDTVRRLVEAALASEELRDAA